MKLSKEARNRLDNLIVSLAACYEQSPTHESLVTISAADVLLLLQALDVQLVYGLPNGDTREVPIGC
jgi:hypothetical protein